MAAPLSRHRARLTRPARRRADRSLCPAGSGGESAGRGCCQAPMSARPAVPAAPASSAPPAPPRAWPIADFARGSVCIPCPQADRRPSPGHPLSAPNFPGALSLVLPPPLLPRGGFALRTAVCVGGGIGLAGGRPSAPTSFGTTPSELLRQVARKASVGALGPAGRRGFRERCHLGAGRERPGAPPGEQGSLPGLCRCERALGRGSGFPFRH